MKPRVLKSDGIKDPSLCFEDPWRQISHHGFQRDALRDDRPQAIKLNKIPIFLSKPKGSGSDHDRVLEFDFPDGHREIRTLIRVYRSPQMIFPKLNTGPSLQTLW